MVMLTLSEVNAGALVRAVLDAVHAASDATDITDADFAQAMTALEVLASRQNPPGTFDERARRLSSGTAIGEIVATLKRLREATS